MTVLKCKMCGGDLAVTENEKVVECEYCGSSQTIPDANNEKKVNLFNRANRLRMASEFDKAAGIYESIIAEFPDEAEAYWGLCLCRYGIEYVDDPTTERKIPTCHRASFDKMRKDENYEASLEYADVSARIVYEDQAKEIDRIMGEILSISKNEEPYDIFICYKETDNAGARTPDSVLAQDIYDALSAKGYRVFFARITLEDKLGLQYEPYIFAALHSAKVMLAVGTDYEYFNAVWVKNEWSRFIKMAATDKSKILIPCYKNMDPYDMPDEFRALQSQDCGKIGFMQDLLRGIDKLFGRNEKPTHTVEKVIVKESGTDTSNLVKRMFLFLSDGNFDSAKEYSDKILDIDVECGEAYLGALMAEIKIKERSALKEIDTLYDKSDNFIKAVRFGDESLKTELNGNIESIKERLYNRAKELVSDRDCNSKSYTKALELMQQIQPYRDAKELESQYLGERNWLRIQEESYNRAKQLFNDARKSEQCKKALNLFKELKDYRDAGRLMALCEEKLKGLEDRERAELEETARRNAEQKRLAEKQRSEEREKAEQARIEQEREEEERKKREKRYKRNRILCRLRPFIIGFLVIFAIVLYFSVIKPKSQLSKAKSLIDQGRYPEASELMLDRNFDSSEKALELQYDCSIRSIEVGDYKSAYPLLKRLAYQDYADSKAVIKDIEVRYNKACIADANVGDIVTYGKYHDPAENDGIKWLLLEKSDNKALLLSYWGLDAKPYNETLIDVSWDNCTLRSWLNSEFLNEAFSFDAQVSIADTLVPAEIGNKSGLPLGNDTVDKVFLLSTDEVGKYDLASTCGTTSYAMEAGATDTGFWWTRSHWGSLDQGAFVRDEYLGQHFGGIDVDASDGIVRPAIWVNLE